MVKPEDDDGEAKAWGQALQALRHRAALTQEAAGERIGISGQAWRKYEAGVAPSIFKPDTQRRLAGAVGATIQDLTAAKTGFAPREVADLRAPVLYGARPQQDLALLPVRDRVQAGAWLSSDDMSQDQPRTYPSARDPRFPHAQQWLSEVVGDSINLLGIQSGDLIHCVDTIAIGYYPKTGDLVEVERLRFGGAERELTVKEVEITADGPLLWPRSTNPRWDKPLALTDDLAQGEEFEVRIRGLVLAAIRRF